MKKLKGWKQEFLSQAGREVLIKAVAQAIQRYSGQCFTILVSILKEMERLCQTYNWEQRGRRKNSLDSMGKDLCFEEGRGFRNAKSADSLIKVLLAKQAWKVMTNKNSLMAKTLKNKYFPNSSFMNVKMSSVASYTWHSILSAREVLGRVL